MRLLWGTITVCENNSPLYLYENGQESIKIIYPNVDNYNNDYTHLHEIAFCQCLIFWKNTGQR